MAEDQNLLLGIDAQIGAAPARVAGDEAKRLDIGGIAHIRDDHAEDGSGEIVARHIGDAVIDPHGVEAGPHLGPRSPLGLGPGGALGDLEIGMAENFEILCGGIGLDPHKVEVEYVHISGDGDIGDIGSDTLRCCGAGQQTSHKPKPGRASLPHGGSSIFSNDHAQQSTGKQHCVADHPQSVG